MSKARSPQVVAIAEKLARDCPYGSSDTYKIGAPPSAADYHAARIALRTLEEIGEYEYAVWHSFPHSENLRDYSYVVGAWGGKDERTRMLKALDTNDVTGEYKLIKRRKAGPHEDV
jgi:hypothetical protein